MITWRKHNLTEQLEERKHCLRMVNGTVKQVGVWLTVLYITKTKDEETWFQRTPYLVLLRTILISFAINAQPSSILRLFRLIFNIHFPSLPHASSPPPLLILSDKVNTLRQWNIALYCKQRWSRLNTVELTCVLLKERETAERHIVRTGYIAEV